MLANGSKAKKHYRIRAENANSLCLQTARKQNSMDTPIDPQKSRLLEVLTNAHCGVGDGNSGYC